MANIHIPNVSLINAINDSKAGGGTFLYDAYGKPVSSKEMPHEAFKRKRRYCLPINEEHVHYYKAIVKDKVYVSYVINRPVPKGTEAISTKKAFEIMFGKEETNKGTNKNQWKKVTKNTKGSVLVENTENYENLPNPNNEEEFNQITKQQEVYNG